MRALLNGGGLIAFARMVTIGPYLLAWHVGADMWHTDGRPWLSARLTSWGSRLA